MCGIAGHFSFNDVRPGVNVCQGLLVGQEIRGRSAAGVAYQTDAATIQVIKQANSAGVFARRNMTEANWAALAASPWALMHARATTQGTEQHNENNHPVVANGYLVTHNGQVSNDDDLFAHYEVERVAEVDTVAINTVLSQGATLEESLAHLSTLAGSATFAAWTETRPDQVILARINGPMLYLHHSADGILYWSSDNSAIFRSSRMGPGGLHFTNITALPQNTALVLNRNGHVARFEVARSPFFRPKVRKPVVAGDGNTDSNREPSATGGSNPTPAPTGGDKPVALAVIEGGKSYQSEAVRRALARQRRKSLVFRDGERSGVVDVAAQQRLTQWFIAGIPPIFPVETGVIVSSEDYLQLKRPFPDFTTGHIHLMDDPPTTNFKILTPYGSWTQQGATIREFKGAKRVRPYWEREIETPLGIRLEFPASVELQETLEGTMALERVELVSHGVHYAMLMCPWCGVITRINKWLRWGTQCAWCRVRSYHKG